MKSGLIIALCAAVVVSGFAADDTGKKKKARPGNALPPKSPMLHVSAPSEDVIQLANPNGLITTELWGRDLEFLRSRIEGGLLELQLGDLVKSRAQNERLKSIGTALFASQEEENRQVAKLAGLYGFAISPNAGIGPQRVVKGIERLSGADFDRACVENIVHAIQDTVHSYEEGAESQTADIKSFAEQMLVVSRERLRVAEDGLPKEAKAGAPPQRPPAVEEGPVVSSRSVSDPVLSAPPTAVPGSPLKLGAMPANGPFSSPAPVPFTPPSSSSPR